MSYENTTQSAEGTLGSAVDALTQRPDLDGLLVNLPGSAPVYLMMFGCRRHVPDGQTFDRLFLSTAKITSDVNIDQICEVPELTPGSVLASGGSAAIYLVTDGYKYWIKTPETFARYQFNQSRVVTVPQILLDFIPSGPDIVWPES